MPISFAIRNGETIDLDDDSIQGLAASAGTGLVKGAADALGLPGYFERVPGTILAATQDYRLQRAPQAVLTPTGVPYCSGFIFCWCEPPATAESAGAYLPRGSMRSWARVSAPSR
jgi:hypothetical protein